MGVSRSAPHMPHIHAHAHMHTHMYNTKIYMYSNCKWLPPWRHPCLSCLTCMCICACMHACTCLLAWGTPIHPHPILPPTYPPIHPKEGDLPNQLKHYNMNQDISILFEDLKYGWVYGFVGWLMDGSFFLTLDCLLKPPQSITGLFLTPFRTTGCFQRKIRWQGKSDRIFETA